MSLQSDSNSILNEYFREINEIIERLVKTIERLDKVTELLTLRASTEQARVELRCTCHKKVSNTTQTSAVEICPIHG